jgi:hypothetical protein
MSVPTGDFSFCAFARLFLKPGRFSSARGESLYGSFSMTLPLQSRRSPEPGSPENGSNAKSYPSAALIQHTIRVWEPRLGRRLTEEDARRILENVVGFFHVLEAWSRERRVIGSRKKED